MTAASICLTLKLETQNLSKANMKLLIANRGEIALRLIRACRKLGLSPVTVYSDPDRLALHVRLADEAYPLEGSAASETYLHQEKILAIAKKAKVKLIHPGYGFLSENALFAHACEKKGFIFVGPSSQTIALLGDKVKARQLAKKSGVPILEGELHEITNIKEAKKSCQQIGFPLLIKAVGGGGGKGIRLIQKADEIEAAFSLASEEAQTAFKNPKIYIEKFIQKARHIEIQAIADHDGHIVSLGERECSIQRRYQKLLEESPSPFITPLLRRQMEEAAKLILKAAKYTNAGTVEFLVDQKKNFYFLEVNTRLQVEHPVTEKVRGVDLACEQIRIALGNKCSWQEKDLPWNGHAIEARIYAEDSQFFPSPGKIEYLELPTGGNIRLESALYPNMEVSLYYDPLLAKLIAWGKTRKEAIQHLDIALAEFKIAGVQTTIPFFRELLQVPAFQKGDLNTQFVEKSSTFKVQRSTLECKAALAALVYHLNKEKKVLFTQTGKKISTWQQQLGTEYMKRGARIYSGPTLEKQTK